MRTTFMISAIIAILTATTSCTTQASFYAPQSDQGEVDFQLFYDQLSPYGQWVDYPEYGYVWIPDVGPDFAPYETNGYWVMTDYGWTWVSDYSWGWAPFHYGRWDFDDRLGWFWVPDDQWGPAWVTWRRSEGYYGWAPLRPGIRAGYYNDYGDVRYWHFVPDRDFGRPRISRYEVNRRDYDHLLRSSSIINNTHVDRRRNTTYIAGPAPEDVQRVTGRRINSLAIRDNNRPGTVVNRDQVKIFRPQVQPGNRKAAPARVYSRDQVSPGVQRNSQNNIYLPNERRNDKMQQMEQRQNQQRQMDQRQNQSRQIEQQQTQQRQIQQRQMEQQQQIQQRDNMSRRQQRMEQRQLERQQRQQNNAKSARPFGQQKREENRQEQQQVQPQQAPPIEQQQQQQQQPQQQPQSTPENNAPWGGRRR